MRCLVCLTILAITTRPGTVRAEEPAPETITIKDKTYTVYPAEKLRAKGASIPDIPKDQNAAYVYIEAVNAMNPVHPNELTDEAESSIMSGVWPSGEQGERISAWLGEQKVALDLARKATAMPDYSMPLFKGETESIVGALLPNLGDMRQLSKMLVMEGTYLARQGQTEAALENYLAAQRLGGQVSHGCTLIEALVGLAVQNMSNQAITKVLESGTAGPELIKSTIAQMDQIGATYPSADELLVREKFMSAAIVDEMLESPSAIGIFTGNLGMAGPPEDQQDGWYKLVTSLKRLYLPDRTVKKHLKQFYDDVIKASRGGEYYSRGGIAEDKIMAKIPIWSVPARVLLPSLSRVYELTIRGQSNMLRAKTTAGVAAYQKTHSSPPAALSHLVPEYLKAVPIDPMTGLELEYSVSHDGKPVGLEPITSKNEEQLRAKRIRPIIVNARTSEWQQYVQSFKQSFGLTESQAAGADGILRSMESQAISYEVTHGETIQRLRAGGDSPELQRELKPLDEMFAELKKRLDALPTARQRAESKSSQPRP